MIKFSEEVKLHFIKLLKNQPLNTYIRISVEFPGTEAANCSLSFCDIEEVNLEIDYKIVLLSTFVYVKKIFLPYLKNAEVNLISNDLETQITLKAPFVKKFPILKNNSSLKDRIKHFFFTVINPMLLKHNGSVIFIKIDTKNWVLLKFIGGCNGCSMSNITLKENIEKILLKKFPEIIGIKDITLHKFTSTSYF